METLPTDFDDLHTLPFFSINAFEPNILAQILTQIDFEMYRKIKPRFR